jgi:hypothetical protein
MPKKPKMPKPDEQWPDCPRKQREKVPHINLDIKDVVNPCKLAAKFGVRLNQLRAFQVIDGNTGKPTNDFVVARSTATPRLRVHK